jgi:hypothetical protein
MSIYRIYTGADGETPGALALSTCHGHALRSSRADATGEAAVGAGQEKRLRICKKLLYLLMSLSSCDGIIFMITEGLGSCPSCATTEQGEPR